MTKQESASYLCSLISLMESKEDAGRPRGNTLGQEYNKAYEEFITILRKEHEDEARNGKLLGKRHESGASQQGS